MSLKILIATTNDGKVSEFRELLSGLDIEIKSLKDLTPIAEIEETGKTFAANAKLKAKYYAKEAGIWALADDSGLEVEALGNAPGIFSARYAGENATDQGNINKLTRELEIASSPSRTARFVCEMAISNPKGKIVASSKGICRGRITKTQRGNNGFGYDPIFIPDEYTKTFGELPSYVKQEISHRSNAAKKIIEYLSNLPSS